MDDRTFCVEDERQRGYLLGHVGKIPLPFYASTGPLREQRSISANARLWLLHTAASDYTGYSKDEMHEFALARHFGYRETQVKDLFTGEIIIKRVPLKRSSARDKKEFAQFMESTEVWYGTEFGVWLPHDQ